jgi:hypothetical protein
MDETTRDGHPWRKMYAKKNLRSSRDFFFDRVFCRDAPPVFFLFFFGEAKFRKIFRVVFFFFRSN